VGDHACTKSVWTGKIWKKNRERAPAASVGSRGGGNHRKDVGRGGFQVDTEWGLVEKKEEQKMGGLRRWGLLADHKPEQGTRTWSGLD